MISHANPEDNEFTLWLAPQLVRQGYKVWSDVTKLFGGEQFWADIEDVIRTRTIKVLYVLSRTSNESGRGFRKELHLADSVGRREKLRNFIIPLAIDELPPSDYNVYVQQLNSVPFRHWASGLKQLLGVLKRDRVPTSTRKYNPATVSSWWRSFRSARAGVSREPDKYYSNWFEIKAIPNGVFWHTLESEAGENVELDIDLPFPVVQHGMAIMTFADEEDVNRALQPRSSVVASEWLSVDDLRRGVQPMREIQDRILKNLFTQLLRRCWDAWIEKRGVGIYELSGRARCAFFLGEEGEDSLRVTFTGVDGAKGVRSLIGTWTRTPKIDSDKPVKRYWHFAVQARPRLWPFLLFHVSSHVIFSDDGRTPWESHRRMHRARRSRCKSWYNDEWRDRLLAAMCYLAQADGDIAIPLSSSEEMRIAIRPIAFASKITCKPLSAEFTNQTEMSRDADMDEEDMDDLDGDDKESF